MKTLKCNAFSAKPRDSSPQFESETVIVEEQTQSTIRKILRDARTWVPLLALATTAGAVGMSTTRNAEADAQRTIAGATDTSDTSAAAANAKRLFKDGKTATMFGKNAKAYAQVDLLMSDMYGQLRPEVVDAKDLGSGVIDGVECDHLAFRTKEVDWQIWILQTPGSSFHRRGRRGPGTHAAGSLTARRQILPVPVPAPTLVH